MNNHMPKASAIMEGSPICGQKIIAKPGAVFVIYPGYRTEKMEMGRGCYPIPTINNKNILVARWNNNHCTGVLA
jgi:hypothetical protein